MNVTPNNGPSRHLQLLHSLGFVVRTKEGVFVYYRLADDDVFRLCDIMCDRIAHLRRANMPSRVPREKRAVRRRRQRVRQADQ